MSKSLHETHPDRFIASIEVFAADPALALKELNRVAGKPGTRAVHLLNSIASRDYLFEPTYVPFLARVEELGYPTIATLSGSSETQRLIMKFAAYIAALGMLASVSCLAQTKQTDTNTHSSPAMLEGMPESLERRYALSALPPHLRNGATIFLLDPAKGYVLNNKGTNGMTCIVVRSDWQYTVRPFRNDIYWPVCYDFEGSKTLLQDYMYAAELRARGMKAQQVHVEVTKRFGTAAYPNPARTGIAYMLAPIMRTFGDSKVVDPFTMNMPHYMFYAPNVKNADIGGKPFSQYPFILSMSPGRDDVIILFAGETEKAKILSESKDLLTDLCSYRDFLCTTEVTRTQIPTN